MRRHRRAVDEERVRAAILAAEESTAAPIRVSLAPYFWGDVRRAAHRAVPRGGVLFFVVPARREFAILGDADVHERLGQHTWNAIAANVTEEARTGDLTTALVHGIQDVGRRLAAHFPRREA